MARAVPPKRPKISMTPKAPPKPAAPKTLASTTPSGNTKGWAKRGLSAPPGQAKKAAPAASKPVADLRAAPGPRRMPGVIEPINRPPIAPTEPLPGEGRYGPITGVNGRQPPTPPKTGTSLFKPGTPLADKPMDYQRKKR